MHFFSPIQKLLMKLEPGYLWQNLLNTIYRISFPHNYHIGKKNAVQVYASPSLPIIVNENIKDTSE
jgi:hypothetical protein